MVQSDLKIRAQFQPINVEANEHKWRVRAAFASGTLVDLGEFDTQDAALEWIALKSAEWLELVRCERNLPRADSL
jgi:hypothetical protein